jgi:chitin disaccharide deacetylase
MRLLVVNADDFGLSPRINEGILKAHVGGVVTSTSLMVMASAAADAARAAADYGALSIGLHFVDDGSADLDDPDQVARSFGLQLQCFRKLVGRDPTHVDSHHHVHSASPRRRAVFAELVKPLAVPLRGQSGVAYLGAFFGQWQPGVTRLRHVQRPFLMQLVRTMVGEGMTELGCHPGRTGDFKSSYMDEREVELATLTEPGLRQEIEALGVKLVSFAAFANLPARQYSAHA